MLKPQRGLAWARIGAELGLFLFGALAICLPVGLAPFGFVLVTTSVLYFGRLRRATSEIAAPLRILFLLALSVLLLSLLSIIVMHLGLRDLDIRTRFLLLPWSALWVYALRPRKQWLWCGAALGVFGVLLLAVIQILRGETRAEGWVNAIVLADVTMALTIMVVFARPKQSWLLPSLVLLACSAVIVLSGSRGVLLAMAVVLLVLTMTVRWTSLRVRLLLLAGLVLGGGALALEVPQVTEQMRLVELQADMRRLESGDSDSSTGARLERLQVAYATFLSKPLMGVGIGQFDRAMTLLPVCRGDEWLVRCHLRHAHNDLAEWAATQGVPGLLAILAIYGVPFVLLLRLYAAGGRKSFRGPAATGVMLVVAYMLCGMTQSMFSHQMSTSFYAVAVGVCIGLALREVKLRGAL
ncbi:O-antigen ligase family protein [Xylella fastidiosa]|uniref:O-antigen ligase family protein n=1 Tax=Xylella fastidiosa TaxID=2371 RepID=UPI00073363A7|nr:O-antigen ligase [Xylella fastidiosa]TNW23688.1 O-antigen ligase family protein [Xylella fastidiosa subsp. pauca]